MVVSLQLAFDHFIASVANLREQRLHFITRNVLTDGICIFSDDAMTHVEHAQLGFAGLFLTGTCASRFAVVLPGFAVALRSANQAVIAIACFLTGCHVRVNTTVYERNICHRLVSLENP